MLDPRRAIAHEKLARMQSKAAAAKQLLGRLYVKEAQVANATSKLQLCDDVQVELEKNYEKEANKLVKGVEKLLDIGRKLNFNRIATASAGRDALEVASSVLAGEPDEPVSEPEVEDPASKKSYNASANSVVAGEPDELIQEHGVEDPARKKSYSASVSSGQSNVSEISREEKSQQKLEELILFISACCIETTFKLHAPKSPEHEKALRVSQAPCVQALRNNIAFQTHHRCEPNYGLDTGALACMEIALPYEDERCRLKIGLVKAIMCPQDGMLSTLEMNYRKFTNRCIWKDDVPLCCEMLKALKPITLDCAYAGMRKTFFAAEAKRQKMMEPDTMYIPLPSVDERKQESGLWQKTLFVNYFVSLCQNDAFKSALHQFSAESTPVKNILEQTLGIKTTFHRMLVAREYSFLVDKCPDNAGELVVTVGGGAVKVLRECSAKDFVWGYRYLFGIHIKLPIAVVFQNDEMGKSKREREHTFQTTSMYLTGHVSK